MIRMLASPGTAADFTDDDIDAFLIMANYALTDSAALTVRFSHCRVYRWSH